MKPDFPSLADEIAEPHPDMNIKVAAFTVSEKSSNTMHNKYSNFLCFASFCANLCVILNNFNCNDENRIIGK